MAVIDASLYVSLLNNHETNHSLSRTWFREAIKNQEKFSAPLILLAEVAAALSRGLGDTILAHQAIQQLLHSQIIDLVPITSSLATQAAKIAVDHKIRGCDAMYLALAAQNNDYLITLDQQQFERGAAVVTTRKP